jgi:uncharacterized membrane protein (UPF0127 family)
MEKTEPYRGMRRTFRQSGPWLGIPLLLLLVGCGEKRGSLEDLYSRTVTLPGGQQIKVEVLTNPQDMQRGMMFRDSLAPDRGMLFVHPSPGYYPYWMYHVRIPLDMIWLDSEHRIVEISADTPPCKTDPSQCPQFGGNQRAQFVLELAGGMAAKYNLQLGDTISF